MLYRRRPAAEVGVAEAEIAQVPWLQEELSSWSRPLIPLSLPGESEEPGTGTRSDDPVRKPNSRVGDVFRGDSALNMLGFILEKSENQPEWPEPNTQSPLSARKNPVP